MENNKKGSWDQANQQGRNLDTDADEDVRHENKKAEGYERQSEMDNDDSQDLSKNNLSESDDSYGHGKEYYSRNYVPGGRSSRDDIPETNTGI